MAAMSEPLQAPEDPPKSLGRFFFRKFLREPAEVASVWPSSRTMAREMLRGVRLEAGEAVVELGPGTGPFTEQVVRLLGEAGGGGYLGIDRDPEFLAVVRARFPQLEFVQADAGDMRQLVAARPHLRVKAVISGLPLVAMPKPTVLTMLHAVRVLLPAGGTFRTFSYAHTVVNPASWWLRRQLRDVFPEFVVRGPIVRNVPPALVFEATC